MFPAGVVNSDTCRVWAAGSSFRLTAQGSVGWGKLRHVPKDASHSRNSHQGFRSILITSKQANMHRSLAFSTKAASVLFYVKLTTPNTYTHTHIYFTHKINM